MKRCPSCNRTYSDETITFCLADGSLLSAPYDSLREEAPPTENLPAVTRPVVPPTQPPKPAIPTMTSFPVHHGFAATEDEGARQRRNSRPMVWIICAFAAVAIIVAVVIAFRYSSNNRDDSVTATNSKGTITEVSNSPSPGATANLTTNSSSTSPATLSTPRESKKVDSLADPVLFPSPTIRQGAAPTASPSVDYSRIFSERDVSQKVRVVSKPEPVYTEQARKNQVTGTVVLRAVFNSNGQVTSISAVSGLPDGLTERAIAAARNIKFVPAMKDGRPVSVWTQLEYNFNLY